jgi:hypothetical protein
LSRVDLEIAGIGVVCWFAVVDCARREKERERK